MASLFLVRRSDRFSFSKKNENKKKSQLLYGAAALTQFHWLGLRNKLVLMGVSNHGRKLCDVTKGSVGSALFLSTSKSQQNLVFAIFF